MQRLQPDDESLRVNGGIGIDSFPADRAAGQADPVFTAWRAGCILVSMVGHRLRAFGMAAVGCVVGCSSSSAPPAPKGADASMPADASTGSTDAPAGSVEASTGSPDASPDAAIDASHPADATASADAGGDATADAASANCTDWDAEIETDASDVDGATSVNAEGGGPLPGPPPGVCSLVGDTHAPLEVINDAPCPIDAWWVDYECQEQYYGTIQPNGGTWSADTFETHPWRLRKTGSEVLLEEIPPAPEGVADASLRVVTYP